MLENDKEKVKNNKIYDVEFSFVDEGKSQKEIEQEVQELIKRRNEILKSKGIIIESNCEKDYGIIHKK